MFENAKIGDKVWSIRHGWGKIYSIKPENEIYLLKVEFDSYINQNNYTVSFTFEGKSFRLDKNPTLYWDELEFDIPKPPKRLVKKTISKWINVYAKGLGDMCYVSKELAVKYKSNSHTQGVYVETIEIKHEYEVLE